MTQYQFSQFVALRYSMPYLRRGMTSFLSFVSLLGLALAVFALILVMSIMNGFEKELQSRMLALIPHAQLNLSQNNSQWENVREQLKATKHITGVAPYVEGIALLSANERMANTTFVGIDTLLEQEVSALPSHLIAGDFQSLSNAPFRIIIGRLLALRLGLTVGDKVNLTIPRIYISPFGPITRQKRFEVVGVFEVGAELDQNLVLTDMKSANILLGRKTAIDGLRIAVDDQYRSRQILEKVMAQMTDQGILSATEEWTDWRERNSTLYRAVMMEKIMIFVLLMAVVAVASFNVISIVLMTVTDKRSNIAVLKTMGASPKQIRELFILQGSMIGTLGTLSGVLLGVIVAPNVGTILRKLESISGWTLFDPSVYFIPFLPSDLQLADVLLVTISAIAISIIVTVIPAVKASKIPPALSLRENV